MIKLKRAYDEATKNDGFRVLVDRLWPRGISKEKAHLNLWMKDIAPSTTLRKWFKHDPKKWLGFQEKYKKELMKNKELIEQLKEYEKKHKILTLVYAAKDTEHNEAVILLDLLK
ncbi:MAG: DUF488 family protein [Candidatus Pacebacteria bacterium]|jgi:uncharacterized protein YeaO (DUF488 family)|nr:DUF488 family protein [Candidatus Paceibacterota bacterium]